MKREENMVNTIFIIGGLAVLVLIGWAAKEFINVKLAAYEISDEPIAPVKPTTAPAVAMAGTGGGTSSQPFPFIGIIGLLWFMSLFRRRRVR